MENKLFKTLGYLSVLAWVVIILIALIQSANAEELTEEQLTICPEGGIYADWLPITVPDPLAEGGERKTYGWIYGQKFGGTVLSIQGEMFKDAYLCDKYEGESRPCTDADFRFIKMAFKGFQEDEIIWLPDWFFTDYYVNN